MIEPKKIEINIRQNLKNFFLEDVIQTCPHRGSGKDQKNCLLILDDVTSKILDTFIGVIDLIEGGIIGIEKLKCVRKKFKQFHAIYFVEPTEESINYIIEDFLDEKTPKFDKNKREIPQEKGPLYNYCHLIFNKPIDNRFLQKMSEYKNLIYAMLSIRYIQLDLFVYDENLFSLEMNQKDEWNLFQNDPNKVNEKFMEKLVDKVLSIFTLIKKLEFVQIISENQGISGKLADLMNDKLKKMIDKICKNKITKNIHPPVFFVILNRGFDLQSPLMNSLSYSNAFYNFLNKEKPIMDFEVEQENGQKVSQTCKLNETDSIWLNFKFMELDIVAEKVGQSYNDFIEKSDQNKNKDALDKLRELPEMQEFSRDYTKHINTLVKLKNFKQNSNFNKILDFEQGIATSVQLSGKDFTEENIIQNELTDSTDKIRLALIAHYSLWNEQKIKDFFLKDSQDEEKYKKILEILDGGWEMDKDKEGNFKKRRYNLKSAKKELDPETKELSQQYYQPVCVEILSELVNNNLWNLNTPINKKLKRTDIVATTSTKINFFEEKIIFPKTEGFNDIKPIVVFFFLGGISINEQEALTNFYESQQVKNFKLIYGGSSFHYPKLYLEKFIEKKVEEKEAEFSKQSEIKVVMNQQIEEEIHDEKKPEVKVNEMEEEDEENKIKKPKVDVNEMEEEDDQFNNIYLISIKTGKKFILVLKRFFQIHFRKVFLY